MTIDDGKVVSIAYVVRGGDDDEVIDAAEATEPLEYLHGPHSGLIPGLVTRLAGHVAGDHLSMVITPEEGYGARDEAKVRRIPVRRFGEQKVRVGALLRFEQGGRTEAATVLAIQGDYATVDLNHPLAGLELKFEVDVVNVREATPEELDHGHPHGAHGHHH
jgi:FKBP-type peptidyl-prolyl cis-trans isomerase SlyD